MDVTKKTEMSAFRKFLCLICLLQFLLAGTGVKLQAQVLNLPQRSPQALSGTDFIASILDSSMTPVQREARILNEIERGNVPTFYRTFKSIRDTILIEGKKSSITYFVAPDYLMVGSDTDYFYCPLTARSAQLIASKLKCILPTRKMVDRIYQSAVIKLDPEPIPPSMRMMTVPVFMDHNELLQAQLKRNGISSGSLIAGHKKDVVISNKIKAKDGTTRVVIYGWHKLDGKAIQPLYNGHKYDWVDYSHGIRLVQNQVLIDGHKRKAKWILRSKKYHELLSDEGQINKSGYPLD